MTIFRGGAFHHSLMTTAAIVASVAIAGPACAQTRNFNIPKQEAATGIPAFGKQAGVQLLASGRDVAGKRTNAVVGKMEIEEGLRRLLAGTGLAAGPVEDGVIPIRVETASLAAREIDAGSAASDIEDAEAQAAEEIVVTGTNIRGHNNRFSPVQTFDREDLDRSGFKSATELIASLPQNFGGGVSFDNIGPGTGAGPGAAAINLRGLDAGGTLTLLNGKRLPASGLSGQYVDISAIPASALERVEILTDGASAIYGSDAIAGVVNFILRKDYNGAETRLRLGTLTKGDGDEFQFGQTIGRAGENGRALLSFEYTSEDALRAVDKPIGAGNLPTTELLPSTERYNMFGSAAVRISDSVELSTDGFFSDRRSKQTFESVFIGELSDRAHSRQYGLSLAADIDISSDWRASLSSGYARSRYTNRESGMFGFNDRSNSDILSLDALAEGPVVRLGGGDLRAVGGYQFRREAYDGITTFSGFPIPAFEEAGKRKIHALFGELYIPIVSKINRMAGIEQLSVSLAARHERYSDFGSTTNPKLGLVWSPISSVRLRGTYGTSFRAPRLDQLSDKISFTEITSYVDPASPTGSSTAFYVSGSRDDLEPENSKTWTAGLDFEPTFIKGFLARVTYYSIEYTNRIDTPLPHVEFLPDGRTIYSDHPIPEVRNPSISELQGFIDRSPFNVNSTIMPDGSFSTLSDVTVFLDGRRINTTSTLLRGIDFDLSYRFNSSVGRWYFGTNISYITKFDQQFSERRPVESLLNQVFRPVDLRMRGTTSWTRGGLTVSLFANYIDSYRDDQPGAAPEKIESWLTLDGSIQYEFPDKGPLRRILVTLSGQNIFDNDPPLLATRFNPSGIMFNYDTANADPQGRRIALQITKRW